AGVGDEVLEVLRRAEVRVHAVVVGHVVAPVGIGRRERRVQPDAVDAQPLEVVQARPDAAEVADPVAVAVREGPRVDLIQNAVTPPVHGAAGYEAMNERKPYLQMAAGPVALVVVAIVLLVVSSSTVARAVALTLFGIAGVIAVSLVFFAVGRSEDEERAAQEPPKPAPRPDHE